MEAAQGTDGTRAYYAERGWEEEDGEIVEGTLFGTKEDGPLRAAAYDASVERIRHALSLAGPPLRLLECGCGGYPETSLLDLCSHYTGIDFSEPGLAVAAKTLEDFDVEVDLRHGDICAMPFDDESFDAVYSAHVLYHVADEVNQQAAFEEIVRVLRPGGVAVLVVANPRPLLFPGRAVKRIIADTPQLAALANKIRTPAPIPFKPLTIGKMRGFLEPNGSVEVDTAGIPTVMFNQRVTEFKGIGRYAWRAISWLETKHPKRSARLGNYVQISFVKGD